MAESDFSEKNHFSRFLDKKGPKRAQNEVFGICMKIELLILAGITLKWKILWSSSSCANHMTGEMLVLAPVPKRSLTGHIAKIMFFRLLIEFESFDLAVNGLKRFLLL